MTRIEDFFPNIFSYAIMVSRYIAPILAIWILSRCSRSMLRERYEPEVWAYLELPDGNREPLSQWECIVGRSASSDVVLKYPEVSRTHAALIRSEKCEWTFFDIGSSGGSKVNGEAVTREGLEIRDGDELTFAGRSVWFIELTEFERAQLGATRTVPGRVLHPGGTFFLLTVFQTLLAMQHAIAAKPENVVPVTLAFGALIVAQWAYYLIMRAIRRMGFEVETIAFFLSTLGFSVAASSVPGDMARQAIFLGAGLFSMIVLGSWQRDLNRVKRLRWHMGAFALALLGVNLVLAQEMFGARNWITIAGFSFQPSEFVKIAYIYTGAATLERLFIKRNLLLYILFSAACVGALALMGDFGTAVVFFGAFLVISYMRSGNLATVILAVSGAGIAGMIMLIIRPHIAARFANWGHIWETPYAGGYQQTRALSAAASGGLFGHGAGRGWLHNIVAADTDMVFCLISEELGLIVALTAVAAVILLAVFAVHGGSGARSSFYVIAACAAVAMMLIQVCLGVLGSVDILPFTGVTFPFVSRGGSSFISCWAMLSFIKAGDTRKNASFATKLPSSRFPYNDADYDDEDYDDDYEDEE